MSHKRNLIVPAALLALSLAAGGAYAEQSQTPPQDQTAPHQGSGAGMTRSGRMMGEGGGMQGMMGMTAQASKMMDACSDMMESAMHAPNGQWQKPNQVPENKG